MAWSDESTVSVAGNAPSLGGAVSLVSLPLGATDVDVLAAHPAGLDRNYTISITREPGLTQSAYIKASNTGIDDIFGEAIAVDGDTLVVGAPQEAGVPGDPSSDAAPSSGAVYVFRRSAGGWEQEAYLKAPNAEESDFFGIAVAVSGDVLVVGAPSEDSAAQSVDGDQSSNGAPGAGAAYVFRRTDTAWVLDAYLKADNTGANDAFGRSVAIAGNTIVVGAPGEASAESGTGKTGEDNSAPGAGAAYVFRYTISGWWQQSYIKASNTDAGDEFGTSVAVAQTEALIAVGAWYEDSAATDVDGNEIDNSSLQSGAVYVFRDNGPTWLQEVYVKASNTDAGDSFGAQVLLWGDTMVVGAPHEDSLGLQADNSGTSVGAVYVFRRAGTTWAQEQYLKASNRDSSDWFGSHVALSGDLMAVGAPGEDGASSGIGGLQADNSANGAGAVYVFRRTGTIWNQEAYVKASNTNAGDRFAAVTLSQDTLAVGAPGERSAATGIDGAQADNSKSDAGAVYVFR